MTLQTPTASIVRRLGLMSALGSALALMLTPLPAAAEFKTLYIWCGAENTTDKIAVYSTVFQWSGDGTVPLNSMNGGFSRLAKPVAGANAHVMCTYFAARSSAEESRRRAITAVSASGYAVQHDIDYSYDD